MRHVLAPEPLMKIHPPIRLAQGTFETGPRDRWRAATPVLQSGQAALVEELARQPGTDDGQRFG
jgi:hypothetical protein